MKSKKSQSQYQRDAEETHKIFSDNGRLAVSGCYCARCKTIRRNGEDQMNTWHSMESAPRTGKSFLVFCPIYKNIFCVAFNVMDQRFEVFGGNGATLIEDPIAWTSLPDISSNAGVKA